MLQKIDELKTQPIIGQMYLVPCIIKKYYLNNENWYINSKNKLKLRKSIRLHIYPIINHLHSDKENGQNYKHYHVDFRFIETGKYNNPLKLHSNHEFAPNIRYDLEPKLNIDFEQHYKIEYKELKCIRLNNYGIAGQVKIDKLKNKCIKNNKCPHRGYNLSQEPVVFKKLGRNNKGGKWQKIIECPLHGLKFNAENKQLIE
jgi:nitrite reductase/ring-hydroxylating ferredoxin subunit